MNDKDFEKIWAPVKSVIEYKQMGDHEALTLGGQFGKLKTEIKRLQKEVDRYERVIEEVRSHMEYDASIMLSDEDRLKGIDKVLKVYYKKEEDV